MNIFLISNMYPSKKDPLFGVFVKNFKNLLKNENVNFVSESLIKGKRNNNINKAFTYFKYYFSIVVNYFSKKYDLLYVHYLSHNSPILYFILLFKKKKPLVINVHGSDIINSQGKFINKFNKTVLKKTELVIVPSQYFKTLILEYYVFLKNEQVFISPSGGIDSSKFFSIESSKKEIPVLGLISRIDEGKGWDDLLKAINRLNNKGLNFKVIIAGQGLQEKDLIEMISKYNLKEKVEFLGLIKQENLVHLYNKIDALVFPTKREAESLGLVGLEAMSCKTPVLGSNIAGLKTYIKDGYNGFLFEPNDVTSLCNTVEKFLNLSEIEKNNLSENALITSSKYEAKYIAKILKNKLSEICYKN
tara:strand:- start:323 stop:1402 length:1080 start_codon:yes stop_codon:yes gene_type:complete